MGAGSLITRIERLEAKRPRSVQQVHRIVSPSAETNDQAMRRYEQETGCVIDADDFVIRRVLVSPEGREA